MRPSVSKFWLLLVAAMALFHAAPARAEDTIRIGQATTSLSFLPIWSARALDAFKPQGLTLNWAAIPGGDPNSLAALDSGDIDLAAVGTDTTLLAIAKGQPFQIVYSLMSEMSSELVVSEKFLARAGVSPTDPLPKRLQALKGAIIGVSAVRGAQDRAVRWLAAQGGLDPAHDLSVAMVGGPPALRAALENGRIDGFLLSPPEGFLTEQSKAGKILIRLAVEFPDLRDFPFLVLVAKKPLDGARAAMIGKTLQALRTAGDVTIANPAKIADEIRRQFFAKEAPEAIAAGVEAMKGGLAGHGTLTHDQMQKAVTFASATGSDISKVLAPRLEEGDFWTNALAAASR